jgi:hypothetical protein
MQEVRGGRRVQLSAHMQVIITDLVKICCLALFLARMSRGLHARSSAWMLSPGGLYLRAFALHTPGRPPALGLGDASFS